MSLLPLIVITLPLTLNVWSTAPSAPSAPAGPVAPVLPVGPVAPVAPVSPFILPASIVDVSAKVKIKFPDPLTVAVLIPALPSPWIP